MYWHFVSYLGFCSTEEDQIHIGATIHIAYPILPIPCLLIPWRLKELGHQQAWSWPNKQEYSVSSIRRVNRWYRWLRLVQDCSNSIANALELLESCIKPQIWYQNSISCSVHQMAFPVTSSSASLLWFKESGMYLNVSVNVVHTAVYSCLVGVYFCFAYIFYWINCYWAYHLLLFFQLFNSHIYVVKHSSALCDVGPALWNQQTDPSYIWGFAILADSLLFSVNNILAGLWLNCISSVEITLFLLADILLQHRALFQCQGLVKWCRFIM